MVRCLSIFFLYFLCSVTANAVIQLSILPTMGWGVGGLKVGVGGIFFFFWGGGACVAQQKEKHSYDSQINKVTCYG